MDAADPVPGDSCSLASLLLLKKLCFGVKGREHNAVVGCNGCRTSVVTCFHPGEGSCCVSVFVNPLAEMGPDLCFLCLCARSASCREFTEK